MRTLNAKSFWTYSAFGLVIGGVLCLLVAWPWVWDFAKQPAPDYADHLAKKRVYESWRKANGDKADQRLFEDVLAGNKSTETLEASERREVAESLRVLMKGAEANPDAWAKALTGLFLSPEGKPRVSLWIECSYNTDRNQEQILDKCWFNRSLAALNDPVRVAKILKNDPAGFTEAPEAPSQPSYDGAKYLAAPSWLPWAKWTVFAALFGIAFCAVGVIIRAASDENDRPPVEWGHPFRGWPNFILGWLVMLALAPGFLATRLLYILAIDVTPAANAWLKPGWKKFVALFVRKPSFADEYEEFAAQLSEMNRTAAAAGNGELLKEIAEISEKVRHAQDSKKLTKLKNSLANMRSYIQLTSELEQEF